MTPTELRALADAATPGPWRVHGYAAMEEARIYGNGADRGDFICMCDGRRTLDYDANARLIALGPDAARLLADAMEFMAVEAGYFEHHPDCALYLPQKECDCGTEDREALLARFSALGKDPNEREATRRVEEACDLIRSAYRLHTLRPGDTMLAVRSAIQHGVEQQADDGPCDCGCPSEDYDGHCCEDYTPGKLADTTEEAT